MINVRFRLRSRVCALSTDALRSQVGASQSTEVSALNYFELPYGSHWLSLTAWLLALHVVSFRFRIALAFSAISHYRRFLHECGAACLRLRRGRPQHLIIRMLTVEFHPGLHGSAQIHHRDDAENSRDVA